MTPDLSAITDQISLTPNQALGIPIALIGAVFLALGAQFQHRGVNKVDHLTEEPSIGGLNFGQLLLLLRRPSWVIGTLMLGLAIVFQLTALIFAPLIVVQPLGAIALIITAIVNSRVSGVRLRQDAIRPIIFCVGGVALFVTFATIFAQSKGISPGELVTVLIILGVVTIAFAVLFAFLRKKIGALIYIVAAGVLYGFVATLAKVVIDRVHTIIIDGAQGFEWLTIACVVALLAATILGGYFVQTAYSSGPPDLVIAGLTVIDPLVAVSIGIIVLQEASGAPWYAILAFVVAGALSVYGVVQLSKREPGAVARL
ncbi:DMT family transporter [Frigoribacterium sp. CG_9.8]|uniref:DMT family transporter n=1 Tax=Frigoribacterium sp. CG_9.8 TaxID=2787733 RepID=UPI0018C9E53F|nr:drug/metabolite transporter (DMT)-like permease [Frigoribacterium sp. CG_9.8]